MSIQSIKQNVMDAFQEAEEMSGVDSPEEYGILIDDIIKELIKRKTIALLNK